MEILFKKLTFPDGAISDLKVLDGKIVEIGASLQSSQDVIDCTGLRILPGLVDLHTHLREPGKESAETVLTGSRAAAAGGFTAISPMANTNPVADSAGVVEQVWRLGKAAGLCDVFPIGAVSEGLEGAKLSEMRAMAESAASVRVFSDDGKCVSDPLLMKRALEYVKSFNGVIAQHAQDPRLTIDAQMNDGFVSSQLGLAGWPSVAEEMIIARDILINHAVGGRLHICHVSTKGSVDILRWAKNQGMQVTAEVTPHHLLLTDELVRTYDPVFKVNPPLRSESDVLALRAALADGTIDIVATDHAPHPAEDKDCEWASAAFGMVGLETALSVVISTMIESGLMDWQRLATVLSTAPARIGGYSDHGQPLKIGSSANIVIIDPKKRWTVHKHELHSKSKNTPFNGLELVGQVIHTLLNGEFTIKNCELKDVKNG